MSWLGRLFGSSPPPPPPPVNRVVIADDTATALSMGGADLDTAVNQALREYLEAQRRSADAQARGEKIPFWLRRDAESSVQIEDELRDRVIQRRSNEDVR